MDASGVIQLIILIVLIFLSAFFSLKNAYMRYKIKSGQNVHAHNFDASSPLTKKKNKPIM